MKKNIGLFLMKISGWKIDYPKEFQVKKFVIIAAPHTSNWDLYYALPIFWVSHIPVKFFIKDSFTKGLHGYIFRALGAIGVDRKRTGNLVHHAASVIQKSDKIALMVPAEGTRSRVKKWKTGFYHIAIKSNVPVALGYLDYKKKIAGVGDLVYLTGDKDADMQKIESFYTTITAKHPEKYNKKIY